MLCGTYTYTYCHFQEFCLESRGVQIQKVCGTTFTSQDDFSSKPQQRGMWYLTTHYYKMCHQLHLKILRSLQMLTEDMNPWGLDS